MKKNLLDHEDFKCLRKARYKTFIVLIIIAISSPGFSQELSRSLLCSGGGSFATANQSLEFSIGEIATETYQSESNVLTQGFIQGSPQEIGINENFIKDVDVRIFPNPSKGIITVSCKKEPVNIEIFDLQGRKLFTKQNPEQIETLNIENLQHSIYLLRLAFKDNIPITKRIVKN